MSWQVDVSPRIGVTLTHFGQSRLAVNSVTLGDFEQPIKISLFVKDIFAGFSMVLILDSACRMLRYSCRAYSQLNLKNDTLRRRYDSLKYDIKKIEEGIVVSESQNMRCSCRTVVYDVSLRKLAPPSKEKTES